MPSPHTTDASHPVLLGLRRSGLIAPADRVLVADSGGPDRPARRGVFVGRLVAVWRAEVVDYRDQRGIEPREDPANSDPAYARVRVRLDILPALERDRPGIVQRFHGAATRAAALQETLAETAARTLKGGSTTRAVVAAAPTPVAVELMKQLYAQAGGAQPALSRSHLTAILP